jgi:tetratricopeptide (TPR) repeat protein
MAGTTKKRTIEELLQEEAWGKARKLIQAELSEHPDNHWLLTQLGVTHYEQGRYQEALSRFLASLQIVPDCPLTLWNAAGAFDALGKTKVAIQIYTWLLRSKKSPADDPCWESKEWTDALKTDCVYRLGACFEHLNRGASAEHCFRQYVNLLLAGMNGSYAIEDAEQHVRKLHASQKHSHGEEVRDAIQSVLQDPEILSLEGGGKKLPDLSLTVLQAS